jgi:hypothetical protein
MKANELARDLAVQTWTLIFAAILVPVLAGLIALILIPNGAPTCDMNAIGPENGMCRLPTDPPDAPSTVVLEPADVEHHVPQRVMIIGAGLVVSALLFSYVGRMATRAQR